MPNGMTFVNCSGLILDAKKQHIPGIYDGLNTALKSGKPVFIYGISDTSPIPVILTHGKSDTIVCRFSTTFTVDPKDNVSFTITKSRKED